MRAREELQKKNGREPKISEIAAQVGQSPENVAMALGSAVTPTSLYEPIYSDGEDSLPWSISCGTQPGRKAGSAI